MTVTYVLPTVGRQSLAAALASIECWPGDDILVVGHGASLGLQSLQRERREVLLVDCPPGNDWGHAERNFAAKYARGQYVAHIDDDDTYAPGTRALMADAMAATPDRPVLFRMRYPNGITLWAEPAVRCGNVGTPMMLLPNRPEMLGTWGSFVGGDCHYLETSKWRAEDYVWRPEVIALLGHN